MIEVNEIFGPTIQGEGKSAGKEVMFIRTARCNLACQWCDTPYTWNWIGTKFQHPDKFDPKEEIHQMSAFQIVEKLERLSESTKAVVISGGEPMLQQTRLVKLFHLLRERGYWIEVETNGTIVPHNDFLSLVDQVNCSPKLSNSGIDNRPKMRYVPQALMKLCQSEKVNFKFVVTREEDIVEIQALLSLFKPKEVYLMPEGRTTEEQLARQEEVRQLCEQNQFHFSPRLQILKWGTKRGV